MKSVASWNATIWVGTRIGYSDEYAPEDEIRLFLGDYVNIKGFCVSLTPTEFIYTNGREPGYSVGIIHYAKFPSTPEQLRQATLEIARGLMRAARQTGVSVCMPGENVWLNS